MKRIFTLLLTVAAILSATAQPYLVGHRGSYWGVENTEEASGETLILGMYIWEFIILAVLAVITLFNIALIVLVAIKVLAKKL